MPWLRRTHHLKPVLGAHIHRTRHAPDRIELIRVDLANLVDHRILYVKTQYFAHHQAASQKLRAHMNDLVELALHVHPGLPNTRRFHDVAGYGRQTREFELVDVRWVLARTQIHLLGEILTDDVDYEFTRGFDVHQRVFLGPIAASDHGTEANHRRVRADDREEAEGRQVAHPVRAQSGYERDRTRKNGAR